MWAVLPSRKVIWSWSCISKSNDLLTILQRSSNIYRLRYGRIQGDAR